MALLDRADAPKEGTMGHIARWGLNHTHGQGGCRAEVSNRADDGKPPIGPPTPWRDDSRMLGSFSLPCCGILNR